MFPDLPKPMVPIGGVPFLKVQMDTLYSLGVSDFVLCIGYRADAIISHFSSGDRNRQYGIQFSAEKEQLGTGGAIKNALSILENEFLVVNGDTFAKFDLAGMAEFHRASKSKCTLLLARRQDTADYGTVKVESSSSWKVTGFEEKGASPGPALVSAGAYIVNKEVFEDTPARFSFERELLPVLVDRKVVYGYLMKGQFVDIGTPERFLEFKRQAESQL
jgi:NDP-sugar pyrophosphorylase family protein